MVSNWYAIPAEFTVVVCLVDSSCCWVICLTSAKLLVVRAELAAVSVDVDWVNIDLHHTRLAVKAHVMPGGGGAGLTPPCPLLESVSSSGG